MIVKKLNLATLTLSVFGVIVCVGLTVLFYRQGRSGTDILAAVGSVASLFGLVIAIVQILAIRKVTDATHTAVQQTKEQLFNRLSLADVARATRLIEQIQLQLLNEKLELAHLRFQDLHAMLIQFRAGKLINEGFINDYDDLLKSMGIHSENLYRAIYKGKTVDITIINHTLQSIVGILVTAENDLCTLNMKSCYETLLTRPLVIA